MQKVNVTVRLDEMTVALVDEDVAQLTERGITMKRSELLKDPLLIEALTEAIASTLERLEKEEPSH